MAFERIVLEKSGLGGQAKSDHRGICLFSQCLLQDSLNINIRCGTHALLAVKYDPQLYLTRVGVAPNGLSLVKSPKFLIFHQIGCFVDFMSPRVGQPQGS